MGTNAQNITKKCKTCGKPLVQCQYKGKHPAVVEQNKRNTGYVNGHQWVDLGLSVKWATCNVGATSPEEYGEYYAWGEVRAKLRYDWDNYFDCKDPKNWGENSAWEVYKIGKETQIKSSSGHDTARENWGGNWRMPTYDEFVELSRKCNWIWSSEDGHSGYTVVGANGNSIFLPAAGCHRESNIFNEGVTGLYWTNALSLKDAGSAKSLDFDQKTHDTDYDRYRKFGISIRPVIK